MSHVKSGGIWNIALFPASVRLKCEHAFFVFTEKSVLSVNFMIEEMIKSVAVIFYLVLFSFSDRFWHLVLQRVVLSGIAICYFCLLLSICLNLRCSGDK